MMKLATFGHKNLTSLFVVPCAKFEEFLQAISKVSFYEEWDIIPLTMAVTASEA